MAIFKHLKKVSEKCSENFLRGTCFWAQEGSDLNSCVDDTNFKTRVVLRVKMISKPYFRASIQIKMCWNRLEGHRIRDSSSSRDGIWISLYTIPYTNNYSLLLTLQ